MIEKIKIIFEKSYLPRWLILIIDFNISLLTFILIYMLRFNLVYEYVNVDIMFGQIILGMSFFVLAVYIFKQHRSIIRYSTVQDVIVLIKSNLLILFGYLNVSFLGKQINENFYIPISILFIHFSISAFFMILFRVALIYAFNRIKNFRKFDINIMIYGAGEMGSIAPSVINKIKNKNVNKNIVGYIDDNSALWKSTVNGIQVYSPQLAFNKIIKEQDVLEIIIAISSDRLQFDKKMEIIDNCLISNIKIRELYETSYFTKGNQIESKIREINIEDLLERNTIKIPVEKVSEGVFGKRVMVTGGAGSIGSEIIRQLVLLKPETIILIDQSESAVFEIQNEVLPKLDKIKLQIFISDITNQTKMRRIFERCSPQILYHAAAYKHVPLMEEQPYEAVHNNVGGTKIIADLAVEFNVEKFVLVSTDKAVNPTNIMGATKRISEIYIHSLSQRPLMRTQFITTRFGNVLGSNGSVIPIFKRQIIQGGPVTITHKDVIRYFMTIPEACRLVLEAGFIGNGGEIFIFDMEKPVKIYDLARRMISLSGFVPHQDIEIQEIGLRPGEKLYEELLNIKEETLPTSNEKIMIAKIRQINYREAELNIKKLLVDVDLLDNMSLVSLIKKIVPEYISQNSTYEILDHVSGSKEIA